MVYNCTETILSRLYPSSCQLCRGPTHGLDLCPACRLALPHNEHSCPNCALPLPASTQPNRRCGHCLNAPPAFDHAVAPFLYQTPLNRLISDFKFSNKLAVGRLLAQLLYEHLQGQASRPELIIPMPLHPSRLRERGYNQALELARPLAKKLGIALDHRCCRRRRPTESQAGLDKKARKKNMRGAFEVVKPIAASHVAIVDDVLTTGSTASELAKVLKRAGVERVDVWTLARTP